MAFTGFPKDLSKFLAELAKNNNKAWFDENKPRFAASVQEPLFAFMDSLAPRMAKISAQITIEAKKSGGSLQRIFRDTRFSKDKSPYHTHVSVIFRHEVGKKVPAPGFYLRIDTAKVTLGAGIWQPEGPAVLAIRTAIVEDAKRWKRVRSDAKFRELYGELQGESLKRPPKGFDPEHPHVEDLKRKDLVGFREMKLSELTKPSFLDEVDRSYRVSKSLMKFLCDALDLSF